MTVAADDFTVRPGQVFIPCQHFSWDPLVRFIVESVKDGQAYAVDPYRGRPGFGHHLWVSLKSLHPTGTTATGRERKTGYKLHSGPPAPGQRLCGHCLHYVDQTDLTQDAGGPAGGLCIPCQADIEEQFA